MFAPSKTAGAVHAIVTSAELGAGATGALTLVQGLAPRVDCCLLLTLRRPSLPFLLLPHHTHSPLQPTTFSCAITSTNALSCARITTLARPYTRHVITRDALCPTTTARPFVLRYPQGLTHHAPRHQLSDRYPH